MIKVSASEVAHATGGELRNGADPQLVITGGVETDSRKVRAGTLFVAISGENSDGHDYAQQAINAGAPLVISEQDLDAPHVRVDSTVDALGALARFVLARLRAMGEITVIGVTGSSGKTTTKDLLASALSEGELVLRANCDLVETSAPKVILDQRRGAKKELDPIEVEDAVALLEEALAHLKKVAGVEWTGQVLEVTGDPSIIASAVADEPEAQ